MSIRILTKLLGGVEDLMFGLSTDSQTRDGTAYNITRILSIYQVDTGAALSALDVSDADNYYPTVLALGLAAKGDANWGIWWHDTTEPQANDNGTTILTDSSAGPNGCWKKLP